MLQEAAEVDRVGKQAWQTEGTETGGADLGAGLGALEEAGGSSAAGEEGAKGELGKEDEFSKVGVARREGLEQVRIFWILTTLAFGGREGRNHDTEFQSSWYIDLRCAGITLILLGIEDIHTHMHAYFLIIKNSVN